jgi:hypothetical protein
VRCTQQRCSAVSGQVSRSAFQKAKCFVSDREQRSFEPTALQVAEHGEPALAALSVVVLDGHELLAPVLADADQHERAEPVFFEADAEVNAVGEQIRIASAMEAPFPEPLVVLLPLAQEPRDRRRGEPGRGLLAQERRQRLLEVPCREAAQVENRQNLGDLRRALALTWNAD